MKAVHTGLHGARASLLVRQDGHGNRTARHVVPSQSTGVFVIHNYGLTFPACSEYRPLVAPSRGRLCGS